ncbi:MAG: 1-acyl-sn-glycerol-3-phosphate acyltransferase [Desulfobacteraceae bacterium]|nr:MAG: 1-acyl-sn-glycerol-3-phosphate acyltransferase [Desulfobacteraceae bacterium]
MKNRFISICFLSFIAVSSVFFFLIALTIWLLTVKFDPRLTLLHQLTCFWGALYLWIMPAWSVTISGQENYRKGTTYMIVSNHQSQLDILVAFSLFFHFKWVSKAEVFNIPLIGWNMYLNNYIKLKRGDKESTAGMMADCEKMIDQGNSIYFFPEGTRSKDGTVKTFKKGAFVLAKKKKLPILPIAIIGTTNALPKHSLNFHGFHKIQIHVMEEIANEHFSTLPEDEIAQVVREKIAGYVMTHQ